MTDDGLELLDAYWRAANYLSVGQIYLLDNPLLREPLRPEHVNDARHSAELHDFPRFPRSLLGFPPLLGSPGSRSPGSLQVLLPGTLLSFGLRSP